MNRSGIYKVRNMNRPGIYKVRKMKRSSIDKVTSVFIGNNKVQIGSFVHYQLSC